MATPKTTSLDALPDGDAFDVVVLGAGGAGMSAAVYVAISGARVLLVESTEHVGGTTASSAGTTWVPLTRLAPQVNAADTRAAARTFLDQAVGARSPAALREAFLEHGGEAVATMEDHSRLQYRIRPFHPDYLSELDGATACGRALEPLPFDGRLLGDWFSLVRPPIPEFTVLAGMMVDRDDIPHLLGWKNSLRSAVYVAKLLLRHGLDRLTHPRGTRLLMGNALVGRLLLTLKERQVPILMSTRATGFERGAQGVAALTLQQGEVIRRITVRGGVVLATGGFNRDPAMRAQLMPGIPPEWCPGAPGHTGQAHPLARAAGAHYGEGEMSPCFWAPVSLRQRPDGSIASFPHFVFDRAKPGMVTVNPRGERFLNESTSYHLFGLAMQAAHRQAPSIPAWLVTDAQGLRRYGLGMVRPGGMGLASALADGYVISGGTLADLAMKMGVPADALQRSCDAIGRYARSGIDRDFHRGSTLYQRANGDATWPGPNPSLGPITRPPFYALKLHPGDIGAAKGFATDERARALDAQGRPIPGLYAVGNDQQSIMGGVYPAPGITLGPGLVFAYLAARDAVARARAAAPAAA